MDEPNNDICIHFLQHIRTFEMLLLLLSLIWV